jgi:hypothetical protein
MILAESVSEGIAAEVALSDKTQDYTPAQAKTQELATP